jgi:hypothetical protein
VPPGVNHEVEGTNKAQDQQNDSSWLAFPELLEASGEFRKIHAAAIYTKTPENKSERLYESSSILVFLGGPDQTGYRVRSPEARLQTLAGFIDAEGGAMKR